jgi:hypothetical protein
MGTYVMLTHLSHDALRSPNAAENLCHTVMEHVHSECPGVEWKTSYAVLGGPADYLDIFTAPDIEMAMKVAAIIRTFAHARTEIWAATEWKTFVELMRSLPPATAAA